MQSAEFATEKSEFMTQRCIASAEFVTQSCTESADFVTRILLSAELGESCTMSAEFVA